MSEDKKMMMINSKSQGNELGDVVQKMQRVNSQSINTLKERVLRKSSSQSKRDLDQQSIMSIPEERQQAVSRRQSLDLKNGYSSRQGVR